MAVEIVLSGLVGVSVGSFVNVCVHRIPWGISLLSRSFCPHCRYWLRWYDLVPVVSYMLLGGSCRSCKQRIPLVYPAVEVLVGLVCIALFLSLGPTLRFLIYSTVIVLLLLVALIDWQYLIIPNTLVVGGLLIGAVPKILFAPDTIISALVSALSASLILLTVRAMGTKLFRKEAMGLGDVKFAAVIAFFLGFQGFLLALWGAAVLGLIAELALTKLSLGRRYVNKPSESSSRRVPFGSYLALASGLVLVFQKQANDLLDQWLTLMQ